MGTLKITKGHSNRQYKVRIQNNVPLKRHPCIVYKATPTPTPANTVVNVPYQNNLIRCPPRCVSNRMRSDHARPSTVMSFTN